MEKTEKIVIIGAGVSGLSSFIKLVENGFVDVSILEAGGRIGGRVHSVAFGSTKAIIDLGGQWISGENEVYKMMHKKFDFGDTNLAPENSVYVLSDGKEVSQEKCSKMQLLADEIFENAEEMLKSSETYGGFFERKYREALATELYQDIEPELANMLKRQFELQFNANYALTSWNQIPAKHTNHSQTCEGSQTMTWKSSGYKTLVDFMIVRSARRYAEEDLKILFCFQVGSPGHEGCQRSREDQLQQESRQHQLDKPDFGCEMRRRK
jgi:spermine oxidase